MPLVVATRNPGKRREFEVLLGDLVTEVIDMDSWPTELPEVVEDRDTFEGNAFKKAWEISHATGCTTLADDSGLEVDALGGAPGVYSARYAGEACDDLANNAKLIRELQGVPSADRTARYVAVLCLCIADDGIIDVDASRALPVQELPPEGQLTQIGDRLVIWFRATCEGRIVDESRGDGGFGYDPHFFVDDWNATMAEVSLSKKNERSHRAAAVRKMVSFFSS